jgi:hypothetical protein
MQREWQPQKSSLIHAVHQSGANSGLLFGNLCTAHFPMQNIANN